MGLRIRERGKRALRAWAACVSWGAASGTVGCAALGAIVGGLASIDCTQGSLLDRLSCSVCGALIAAIVGALSGALLGGLAGFVIGGAAGVVEAMSPPAPPDRGDRAPGSAAELTPATAPQGRGDEVSPHR